MADLNQSKTKLVTLAFVAAAALSGCGTGSMTTPASAPAKPAPATPSLADWHDTDTPGLSWACQGPTLLFRHGWHQNGGTDGDSAWVLVVGPEWDKRCQR